MQKIASQKSYPNNLPKRVDNRRKMWYNIGISKSLIRDRETDKNALTICGWAIFIRENCALSASDGAFFIFRKGRPAYEAKSTYHGRKCREKIPDKDFALNRRKKRRQRGFSDRSSQKRRSSCEKDSGKHRQNLRKSTRNGRT